MGTDYVDQSLRVDSSAGETLQKTPSLAGHTLTFNQDSKTLILIGGYSPLSGFNHKILEYDLMAETWKNIPTSGFAPRGIYGHTTAYNSASKTFYIFGGNVFHVNSSFISNKLWAFHYPTRTWSVLPFDPQHSKVTDQIARKTSTD